MIRKLKGIAYVTSLLASVGAGIFSNIPEQFSLIISLEVQPISKYISSGFFLPSASYGSLLHNPKNSKKLEGIVFNGAQSIPQQNSQTKSLQEDSLNASLNASLNYSNEKRLNYAEEDIIEVARIIYAEAATASREERRNIAIIVLNRAEDIISRTKNGDYSRIIKQVIRKKGAFTSVYDNRHQNWEKATGRISMNGYENKIFNECVEDAKKVFSGKYQESGYRILSFHDKSLKTIPESWNELEKVAETRNFVWYAERQ